MLRFLHKIILQLSILFRVGFAGFDGYVNELWTVTSKRNSIAGHCFFRKSTVNQLETQCFLPVYKPVENVDNFLKGADAFIFMVNFKTDDRL